MDTLLFFYVVPLLVLSGLTSMTEAALFSVPLSRVHVAVEQKRRWASSLLRLKQDLRRPIATIVILNNAVNIVGSAYIGRKSAEVFSSGIWADGRFGAVTPTLIETFVGVFTALLTFLVIIFAEIILKTVGERFSEAISLFVARPVTMLTHVFHPFLWAVERMTGSLHVEGRAGVSEEEISAMAKIADAEGGITDDEGELIQNVFTLNDTPAKDIMTHRLKVAFLPAERKLGEIRLDELVHEYSRILVAEQGDLDHINGVVLQSMSHRRHAVFSRHVSCYRAVQQYRSFV